MKQKTTMSTEIEALHQFFAAINRNDMQAIIRDFDPQIVRIEPEGFPTAGTYRGIAEVQEHITKGRGTWAEGTCEPEEFFTQGDKVVVYLHVRVRLKDSIDWIDGCFADGFVFRAGVLARSSNISPLENGGMPSTGLELKSKRYHNRRTNR
jgi:ketosteroid isomerase-like protein